MIQATCSFIGGPFNGRSIFVPRLAFRLILAHGSFEGLQKHAYLRHENDEGGHVYIHESEVSK